jgi:hypothetical protein
MSRATLSAVLLGAALCAGAARAAEPDPAPPASAGPAVPDELRDTLPGGSRLGDAPELPGASIDVLPRPTQIRIEVKRQVPPPRDAK